MIGAANASNWLWLLTLPLTLTILPANLTQLLEEHARLGIRDVIPLPRLAQWSSSAGDTSDTRDSGYSRPRGVSPAAYGPRAFPPFSLPFSLPFTLPTRPTPVASTGNDTANATATTSDSLTMENMTTESPGPEETPQCEAATRVEFLFVNIALLPSVLITLLMSFFTTRKLMALNCFDGRPGLVYPVNMIDEHQQRWSYAAAFLVLTYKMAGLFDGTGYLWTPTFFSDTEFITERIYVQTLIVMIQMLQLSVTFFPIFVLIVFRRNLVANIIGFIYTLIWFVLTFYTNMKCDKLDVYTIIDADYETRANSIAYLAFLIPALVAYVILLAGYAMDFVINMYYIVTNRYQKRDAVLRKFRVKDTKAEFYVRELLKRKHDLAPRGEPKGYVNMSLRYRNIPGFKYSPIVVCTVTVGLYLLFKYAVTLAATIDSKFAYMIQVLEESEDLYPSTATPTYHQLHQFLKFVRANFAVCSSVVLIYEFLTMGHFLYCFRNDYQKYLRGDKSWHQRFHILESPHSQLVWYMKYSGYQVALLLKGYSYSLLVLFLAVLWFVYMIFLPLYYGTMSDPLNLFKEEWPFFVVLFFFNIGLHQMAQKMFLQDQGKSLALRHRRWFHIGNYFMFYYNIIMGGFIHITRLFLQMFIGLSIISRLDRIYMPKGTEHEDPGHSAYLGMLNVLVTHNHPVLKCFVFTLLDDCALQSHANRFSHVQDQERNGSESPPFPLPQDDGMRQAQIRRKRARNRWFKAYTLINNTSILIRPLQKQLQEQCQLDRHVREKLNATEIQGRLTALESLKAMTSLTAPRVVPISDVTAENPPADQARDVTEDVKGKRDDDDGDADGSEYLEVKDVARISLSWESSGSGSGSGSGGSPAGNRPPSGTGPPAYRDVVFRNSMELPDVSPDTLEVDPELQGPSIPKEVRRTGGKANAAKAKCQIKVFSVSEMST